MILSSIYQKAIEFIDSYKIRLFEISRELYNHPETAYKEVFASRLLTNELAKLGFKIQQPVYGLDTAFIAVKRSNHSGPNIAILAEYDALPGLGHACGHNLIATSSLGGVAAVAEFISELGGSIYLYGTPAEETGGGKVQLCNSKAFNKIDAVIMGHPSGATHTWVYGRSTLCINILRFFFQGRTAHAAKDPHLGFNALDGVIQTFNSINALRQQIRPDARIHGIITDGGQAPNIIPEKASAYFFIRASDEPYNKELTKRVCDCARGAAIATKTTLEIKKEQGYRNVIPITVFCNLFKTVLDTFDFPQTLSQELLLASTDFGNVSHICPGFQYEFPIVKPNQYLRGHSRAFADQTLTPIGQEAMINAAKVNAAFTIELLTHPEVLSNAKEELHKRMKI